MWILPSRGRPQNITRFLEAYHKTGATTPVYLRIDEDDPMLGGYHQKYPKNWIVEIGPRVPLSIIYNEFLEDNQRLRWYGFIADDVVPETMEWDKKLIDVAGFRKMVVPEGGHGGTPHFILGGDLVRNAGFLSLPGLNRLYIDTVWAEIATRLGVLVYAPDIVLRHRHFSNKMALYDATYRKPKRLEDKEIFEAWLNSENTKQETE